MYRRTSTYIERLMMASQAVGEASDAGVGRRLGWSRRTVRKWRRACVAAGQAALVSLMGATHTPSVADYQLACRQAFTEFGLPQRLTLDHDTCFMESTSPSPFPRRFHLWLLALGIDVCFIRHTPPREHNLVERTPT